MSDHIPFEIQTEIIKNLPVKSLIRFRSVSKPWKCLIDSSEFIVNYHVNHSQLQHHLLVRYDDSQQIRAWNSKDEKYESIVDDDSFPQNKFPLVVPTSVKQLDKLPKMLGTSQGLFSFYKSSAWWDYSKMMTVVIWNPTIGKSVSVVVPNVFRNYPLDTVVGFGVCPRTMDPMLVKITYISNWEYHKIICIPLQVEIFTLSLGVWRSSSNNVPRKSIKVTRDQVVSVDRFIHWLAIDRVRRGNEYCPSNLILSFDMISEEFTDVYLPDSLAQHSPWDLVICKLRKSLVMLQILEVKAQKYCVWKMEYGAPNTFKKLYVIKSPDASLLEISRVLGFRKTGEPLIDVYYDTDEKTAMFVYEPDSEDFNDIGVYGCGTPSFASSYMETLLLLNN